jgi:FlaA1/EpsC-like NDP-sugar epimerase
VPEKYAMLNQRLGVATLRDVQPEDSWGAAGGSPAVDMTRSGKVALVTGAAGSIGSELVRQLISYEPTLLVMLDNNESGLHDLYTELKPQFPDVEFRPVLADITQRDSLERVYATYRPQIVFHAAAYKHVPMQELFPHESIRVNIGGTRNLAELARDYGVERFVLISTDKAVDPSCVMGASKRAAELLMKALSAQSGHSTLFTAVRFGNVLGSRGSVAPTFNRQIDKGGPVTVTDKDMKRYFMTIAEAVNLVIHAAAMTTGGELFMLQMGEEVPILELAERMIRMRGLRPYDDIEIKFTGVRPGEKLNEKLQRDSEVQISTIHPHIVKLEDRDDWFDAELFMRQSAEVIRIDPNDLGVVEQAQALVRDGRLYSEKAATKMYFDYLVRLIDQERPTGPKLTKPEAVARQWPSNGPSNGHARDVVN